MRNPVGILQITEVTLPKVWFTELGATKLAQRNWRTELGHRTWPPNLAHRTWRTELGHRTWRTELGAVKFLTFVAKSIKFGFSGDLLKRNDWCFMYPKYLRPLLLALLFLISTNPLKSATPPEDELAPKWALSPTTVPGDSPYVWPIMNYRVRSRKRFGTTNTEVREERFHARAPLDAWHPSWRIGASAFFYEWADGRLNLIGRGTIEKVKKRCDHVRVEASVETFLYIRTVIRGRNERRRILIDGRRPWKERWYMSMALQ